MPATPVVIANATAAAPTSAKKPQDAKDAFLALLDLSRQTGDFSAGDALSATPVSGKRRADDITVLAAPTAPQVDYAKDQPVKVKDTAPSDKAAPVRPADRRQDDDNDRRAEAAPVQNRDDSQAPAKDDAPASKPADASSAADKKSTAASDKAAPAKGAKDSAAADAAASPQTDATAAVAVSPVASVSAQSAVTLEFVQLLSQLKQQVDQLLGAIKALPAAQQTPANVDAIIVDTRAHLDVLAPGSGDWLAALLPGGDASSAQDRIALLTSLGNELGQAVAGLSRALGQPIDTATTGLDTTIVKLTQLVAAKLQLRGQDAKSDPQAAALPTAVAATATDVSALIADAAKNSLQTGKDEATKDLAASAPVAVAAQATQDTQVKPATQNTTAVTSAPVSAPAPADSGTSSGFSGGRDAQSGNAQPTLVAGATAAGGAKTDATSTSFARVLSQTTPTALTEQVLVQIKTANASGNSHIRIQLSPEELGRLDIRMQVGADGKTGVTITADNKHTLDLLQRDAQGLERALADAGLKSDAGSLSFNLRGGQQQDAGQQGSGRAPAFAQATIDEDDSVDLGVVSASYALSVHEGLDIKI